LQRHDNEVEMIPVVYQNGNFGNIDRLCFEVVDIEREHFNQALVIGDIGLGAVSKKGKSQRIHCKMTFDAIGGFVTTKAFGCNTGITSIFNRMGVNQNQGCPLWFFLACART